MLKRRTYDCGPCRTRKPSDSRRRIFENSMSAKQAEAKVNRGLDDIIDTVLHSAGNRYPWSEIRLGSIDRSGSYEDWSYDDGSIYSDTAGIHFYCDSNDPNEVAACTKAIKEDVRSIAKSFNGRDGLQFTANAYPKAEDGYASKEIVVTIDCTCRYN